MQPTPRRELTPTPRKRDGARRAASGSAPRTKALPVRGTRGAPARERARSTRHRAAGPALDPRILVLAAAAVVFALLFVLVRGCMRNDGPGDAPAQPQAERADEQQVTDDEATNEGQQPTNPGENPQTFAATGDLPAYVLLDQGRVTGSGDGRVSFAAVGDNLMNENLLALADAWAGSEGDNAYDFTPIYQDIRPLVHDTYDVSFINQETIMGGLDEFDYMGYPSYNTPDEVADALADTGFRLVSTNSNHTYDTWVNSILHDHAVWDARPQVLTAGSYDSEEDRQTVRVVECNGIRISFLAYSYGQNSYEQSDLPNSYYAVPYSKETIRADVERARKVSDFVLVYMHWGEPEYSNEVNDEQRELAQYCADLGVGMVVGSHVHVIQPMEWVERSQGGRMLCAYGLGDFVAGYTNYPDTIMSGMMTCDIVRAEDGTMGVENVVWHPLVEHMEGSSDRVCLVRDYTPEQAEANVLLDSLDDPYQWIVDKTNEVMGGEFAIDM